MKKFKEPDRDQQLLFAEVDLNNIVEEDSPAYIIDHLVNKLDTTSIEKKYNMEIWQGKDPLHPKTYIKVCLLAIHNCRFSLRKMEQDTKTNLVYRWLTGDKAIDHSSIGKFLDKFKTEITDLFSQIILVSKEENLLDFDLLAIDAVKIRANASYKNSKNLKAIKDSKKKIKKQLSELIDKMDQAEKKERSALEKRNKRLTEAEKKLKERMAESNDTKINTTDFDCFCFGPG